MKKKIKFVLWIALGIFILDHVSKGLIATYLPLGDSVAVIPGIFDIVHGRNTGAAFGVLDSWDSPFKNWFFYVVGAGAPIFLYHYLKGVSSTDKVSMTAVAFILGGALGNVADRLVRGSVVDFLSFHYHDRVWQFDLFGYHVRMPLLWPSFNVADSAITVAIFLLVIQTLRSRKT